MKKFIYVFLLIALFSCSKENESNKEPEFFTSDIDLFWKIFDSISPDYSKINFQNYYIDKGTKGLKDYAEQKDLAASLESKLKLPEYLSYYKSIRYNTLDLDDAIQKSKDGFNTLKMIYPEANLFDVYFLIGALGAGGRVSNNGLLIAVEFFTKTDTTSLDNLDEWYRNVIKSKDYIPSIVVHELIHKQQNFSQTNSGFNTLLEQSIMEGMADFVSLYLLPNEPFLYKHLHDYADTLELTLWNEFKKDKDKSYDTTEWLYTGEKTSKGYPADLGYYIGFKIVESYSKKFDNMNIAIQNLLNTSNYYEIFEKSEYEKKFK